MVFGFASFLFFSGFFRKDMVSLIISLLVMFFYGSMWVGILPINPYMSYESHFAGAASGCVASWFYSEVKLRRDKARENGNWM